MAPKTKLGKAAKAMAAKSKSAKGADKEVKKETKTPDKRVRVTGKTRQELATASDAQPSSSADCTGYAKGTISALLTSLKYQLKAKKTTPEQKADAQTTLQDCVDSACYRIICIQKWLNSVPLVAGIRGRRQQKERASRQDGQPGSEELLLGS